jgi:hypothetical protein
LTMYSFLAVSISACSIMIFNVSSFTFIVRKKSTDWFKQNEWNWFMFINTRLIYKNLLVEHKANVWMIIGRRNKYNSAVYIPPAKWPYYSNVWFSPHRAKEADSQQGNNCEYPRLKVKVATSAAAGVIAKIVLFRADFSYTHAAKRSIT